MSSLRVGLIMPVAVSLLSVGTPAFAGSGPKVGPPSVPPGQAAESPGKAD